MIRDARERRRPKMSQEELGQRVGISRPMVSLLERGQVKYPRIGMLTGIADALEIPPATFFTILGVSPSDAAPAALHWIVSQLDQPNLDLLVELGHSLVRVQHRQLQTEAPRSGRR